MEGIQAAVGDKARVIFAEGSEIESADPNRLTTAMLAAAQADVVILVLGESWQMNGEAASRTDIRLPKCQRDLAASIATLGKPCVLITMSGRPLVLSDEERIFPTILHAWAPGLEGGNALADVIFGDFAPVGKLTMAFPRHVGQLPMTYREKPTGRPFAEDVQYTSKYLDSPNTPLFPFGHGLTYATFRHGQVAIAHIGREILSITAEITNESPHPGTETLQLYIRDLVASVTRPVKELRGYQRVTLDAGETRTVVFEITREDLSLVGRDLLRRFEPGEFDIMIGPSSAETQSVRLMLDD